MILCIIIYKNKAYDFSNVNVNDMDIYSPPSNSGEGSTGSGSSGGGGSGAMKSSGRQRSPGATARAGDATDNPGMSGISIEQDEFTSTVNPPTDDEGVRQ